MEYLKKIIRIGFSTFIPFVLLAKIENTYIPYQLNPVARLNEFTFYDLKVLFSHTMPFFYVVAFLLQGLIIIPFWDNYIKKGSPVNLFLLIDLIECMILFSLGSSFVVWDSSGSILTLFKSTTVLMFVQTAYWAINFLSLYLIDKFRKQQLNIPVLTSN
jgi:hypothetical protein